MAKRTKDQPGSKRRGPDPRHFVQVARRPSLGVEVSTGRAWIGVDQQVGHGSADALFALTEEQYAAALAGAGLGPFEGECWRGEHDDLLLFHPGGGSWYPERWSPCRARMLPPRFEGELWWHVDAWDEPADSARAEVSRSLAAGPNGAADRVFRLVGDGAHPRPAALIGGLAPGSDRARARAVLGDPVEAGGDVYAVEGDRVRLGYADGGLVEIALERPAPRPLPEGPVRAFLAVLGEPEAGAAFREVARLAGGTGRRWAASSGSPRRLLAFDGGVEVQVEEGRVLSARVRFRPDASGPAYRHAPDLLPGVARRPTRADFHRALGAPSATGGGTDLYRYGTRDLLVEYVEHVEHVEPVEHLEYAADTADAVTAVLRGTSAPPGVHRWRSGEFTLFLDVLGHPEAHPLVAHVRGLPGVHLTLRRGAVTEVGIGGRGHRSERFAAFVDGMPGEPTRADLPLGAPTERGPHDDLWDFARGWVHVHSSDGTAVSTVTVRREPPHGLAARSRTAHRDR
ncbi:hypothetical protein [Kitasatospora fiedleri]|uniref:hypothetical protein n=1 Tax=Kitasatospora fiedleri TaxID=2991545 RepID=UPI00249CD153|nr:hypothetical protein [Kitasatospora fiedleri]